MPSRETIDELDNYDEQSRYWNFRVKEGDISDVVAERLRFDRERLAERKPVAPGPDNGGDGENQGTGIDSERADNQPHVEISGLESTGGETVAGAENEG